MALTIGLNSVDPKHYAGWTGKLTACEADADDMASIAKSRDMKCETVLTKNATRANVIAGIHKASAALKSGDLFMLTYSGHGGQVKDINNEEPDHKDETWCLYDAEWIDDEIYAELGRFAAGVRILVFSDSCHSGSVIKMAYYHGTSLTRGPSPDSEPPRYRAMPPDVALATYRQNRKFYDDLQRAPGLKAAKDNVKASALLISGCADNQLSSDGAFNGLFTGTMLEVWNDGQFNKRFKTGGYRKFHREIVNRMPPDQTPHYFVAGTPNPAFEKQHPFTV